MGKHITPFKYPNRLNSTRFALNGGMPHSGAWRRLAQGNNFAAQRLRRCVASYSSSNFAGGSHLGPASAAGTTRGWYFPYRSGVNIGNLVFTIGMSPPTSASATDPRVRVYLHDVGAATTTYSDYYRYTRTDGSTSSGSWRSVNWVNGEMAVPAENTLYLIALELEDYGRAQSFLAFERAPYLADDTNTGVCNPTPFEENNDILDADIQDVLSSQTSLWQKNGRILAAWNRPVSTGTDITSTSYVNFFDGSSTVTANTVGATLLTQYLDSRSADVGYELVVAGRYTAGASNLSVRLQSASGTLLEETGITSSTFTAISNTGTFAANSAETKYDLQVKVDANTFRMSAIGLWLYEA